MLRTIIILLLALVIGLGSTVMLYPDEIGTMIGMLQNPGGTEPIDPPDTETNLDVVSLEIDTSAAKTVYKFDEAFTTEGLKVIATLSDGSTKEVSPEDCRIGKVDTTNPGVRQVTVTYEGVTARFEVTIQEKVYPAISTDSLVDITEENDSVPYRVEAEAIDMVTPGAAKAEGCESFVATAPEGAAITSGEQYLTGFGVKWNYFGFTFTAAKQFDGVTLVLRVANSLANDLNAGAVKMYLNFAQGEDGSVTGELPLDGYIIKAEGACAWSDIVIRNLTIPQGTNTLTFEVQGKSLAFDLDYVDFYVGMRYINSVVEITETTTIVKDLESIDTEKAFTRSDVANAHGLKDGQLFVEKVNKESPGKTTNGGSSVGAIGNGSQMSTTLRLAQDATVLIKFKASKVGAGAYYVKDNWNFYIDGVKLTTVQSVNIEGGDAPNGYWWDWIYTDVGVINLTAGDHFFLLEVFGSDCNVDTVEFEVLSIGSFDDSGVNLEDMAKPDPDPIVSTTIDKEGIYTFEAEEMDTSNLTPSSGWEDRGVQIETPGNTDPQTSGGKSIGACGGGYTTVTFTLNDKATIQVYGRISHVHGGSAASYMSMSLGDTALTATGDLNAKRNDHDYYHWTDIAFGAPMELEAGTYTLTINFLKNPNFDCVKIDVLSYGEEEPFATIEAETFDTEGVVTRQDMIDAGKVTAGNYMTEKGNGATCICAFTSGTWFKFNFNVEEAMTLEMFLVGATDAQGYDVSTKFSVKVNGTTITSPSGLLTGSGSTPYWDWQTVSLGIVELQAGDNEIVLTVLDGHPNLDKVFFLESDGNVTLPPHKCESVCAQCGKCTDSACNETACASKCEGHTVVADITINDASNSYKVEAEALDMSTLVGDSLGVTPENFDGGTGLGHISAGGYQSFVVKAEKDVTVKLCISFANANGGSILNFIPAIYVNGESVSLLDGQIPAGEGTPQESISKYYWNVADVHIATLELKAGETYTIKIMVNSGNLDGYALHVVESTPVYATSVDHVADFALEASGDTTIQFETLDLSHSTIALRQDLINAGYTAPGKSEGRIWGMADGTTIRMYVNVSAACDLKITLGGFGTAMSNFTYTFGGVNIAAEGNYGSSATAAGVIGTVAIAEAGVYLFEFTTGGGTDLDYLVFTVE